MSGPYSWEPPNYWYSGKLGGAFGFLTEGGPGENPLTIQSIEQCTPKDNWWSADKSMDPYWNYHCGNPEGLFRNLRFFTPPLEARYGPAETLLDYSTKAQV